MDLGAWRLTISHSPKRSPGGDLAATDEVSAFRWATSAEVAELADEAYAVRVLGALSETTAAAVRAHDGVHLV